MIIRAFGSSPCKMEPGLIWQITIQVPVHFQLHQIACQVEPFESEGGDIQLLGLAIGKRPQIREKTFLRDVCKLSPGLEWDCFYPNTNIVFDVKNISTLPKTVTLKIAGAEITP